MVGRDQDDQWAFEQGYVSVARLAGPHGVRGDVRLVPFTEDEATIFAFEDLRMGHDLTPVSLKQRGKTKDGYIVTVSTIKNREDADRAKKLRLYVTRDSLDSMEPNGPEGGSVDGAVDDVDDYYLTDLIGLGVQNLDGDVIGSVRAVENYGAEDLLELALDEPVKGFGKLILLPFRKALVPDVDLENGFVRVDLAAWMVDHVGGDQVEKGEAANTKADTQAETDGAADG